MKKVKNKYLINQIAGIDLGNKGSGNTALCFLKNNKLYFKQTKKNEDEWILIEELIKNYGIKLICMDAPLSLPGVYFNKEQYDDYLYRECDKACKAMSPMFIGAFTARAIQLKNLLEEKNIKVMEVYPKKLCEILNLQNYYPAKKEKNIPQQLIHAISKIIPYQNSKINSMHEFDALLCWLSAYRFIHNIHLELGNKKEGVIII
jgi:predicted nuclease with RNAse H fold